MILLYLTFSFGIMKIRKVPKYARWMMSKQRLEFTQCTDSAMFFWLKAGKKTLMSNTEAVFVV